jgi:hypothetical protein
LLKDALPLKVGGRNRSGSKLTPFIFIIPFCLQGLSYLIIENDIEIIMGFIVRSPGISSYKTEEALLYHQL